MNTRAYLSRIGISDLPAPDLAGLRRLQTAHAHTVPFENLDIMLGRGVTLDPDALFEKVVTQRRGGFCYELNSLFGRLLEALGYRVDLLSCASANDDGTYLQEYEHLALRVFCQGDDTPYLVDVGWGDGPLEPLRMDTEGEQAQGPRTWKITREGAYRVLTELLEPDRWIKHYRFQPVARALEEFAPMCQYMQTSPESMFTQKRLCTLFTPGGRISLSENKLITTSFGEGPRGAWQKGERALTDDEIAQVLKDAFQVTL